MVYDHKSSSVDFNRVYAESILLQRRPIDDINYLLQSRNEVFLYEGGMFGRFFFDLGPGPFLETIKGCLVDPDPRWRVFACLALAEIRDRSAIPLISKLLNDGAMVPQCSNCISEPVSAYASWAIRWFDR